MAAVRALILVVLAAAGALFGADQAAAPARAPALRVLVFTKTAGFRHASIPAAVQAVQGLGAANGFAVDVTEDGATFSDDNLARYDAVVFLLTSGDVLDDGQQAAFQRFIRSGGGFAGVHSAADTEYDWPWYGGLVGAYFFSHPEIQTAVIDVSEPRDGSTAGLPPRWTRTDEWYNFASNPRGSVHVLATIDESSYSAGDGAMGPDHPIAWWHDYDGGRAWYTSGGHTDASYLEPLFLSHLLGGILYAAGNGKSPAPAQATTTAGPPAILSLATSSRNRRISVKVRVSGCRRCSARLTVGLPGRSLTLRLRIDGASAAGTTTTLPPGQRPITVVITDGTTGLSARTHRVIRVR